MKDIKVGDEFFVKRLGFSNQKDFNKCETPFDFLGLVKITIIKINKISFKTDYNNELFKQIPSEFIKYEKDKVENFLPVYAALKISDSGYYFQRIKGAYKLFSETQKKIFDETIIKIVEKKANEFKSQELSLIKKRMSDECDY